MPQLISQATALLNKHLKETKKEKKSFFDSGYATLSNLMSAINAFDILKYTPDTLLEKVQRDNCINLLKDILKEVNCSVEPLRTIKEIIEENISYYSTDAVYCYWNGPRQVNSTPPGIAILNNDPRSKAKQIAEPFPIDFKEKAIQNLEYLYLTSTGKTLLDSLLIFSQNHHQDENIFIIPLPADRGNNIAHQAPEHALHGVAKELLHKKQPGPQFMYALERATKALNLNDPYQWLAEQINNMPQLNYLGLPGEKPFLPEKNIVFSKKDLDQWLDGELTLDPEIKYHFLEAIIVTLHEFATPNIGTGSIIRWNAHDDAKKNQKRPMAIGLGHELTHAYYNAIGMQPGHQENDDSTVLFEYLATGLGPWKKISLCENALRRQWNEILSKIPKTDKSNHKVVEERLYYDLENPSPEDTNQCEII